jgi:hypothetical protein
MDQLLKSTPATLQLKVYNGDTLTNFDSAPTVAVADDQGTAITPGSITNTTTGVYQTTIQATDYVTTLTATWAGDISGASATFVQQYEVVGNLLFALGELRSYKSTLTTDDSKLVEARNIAAALFETWCNVSFISRPGHEVIQGNGSTRLPLSKRMVTSVTAAEIGGTAVTVDIVHEYGALDRAAGWTYSSTSKNVEVWYAHGYTHTPADVKRAAMEYAAYLLLSDVSTMDQRATGFTNELGLVVRYSPHQPTGLPSVDSTLARYKMPVVGRR